MSPWKLGQIGIHRTNYPSYHLWWGKPSMWKEIPLTRMIWVSHMTPFGWHSLCWKLFTPALLQREHWLSNECQTEPLTLSPPLYCSLLGFTCDLVTFSVSPRPLWFFGSRCDAYPSGNGTAFCCVEYPLSTCSQQGELHVTQLPFRLKHRPKSYWKGVRLWPISMEGSPLYLMVSH